MKETVAFFPTPSSIVEYMITLSGAEKDSKILEAGFGDGAFLNALHNQNFTDVTGVEYATEFSQNAKERFTEFSIFNQDYLSFSKPNYFDDVIGNPPYINSDNLEKSVRESVREITKSGEGNIYYAFIIHSINNLKENGTLTYILPYDFFFNTYADYLRKFMIRNGYFTDIIDLGESKIFKGAAPETIIFKYIKGKNTNNLPISVKQIKNLSLEVIEENILNGFKDFKCYEQDQFTEDQGIWYLSNIKKVDGIKLKDIEGVQVSVGIINGNEEAYIVDKSSETYKQLTEKEKKKFIKKFIKNKDRPTNSNELYSGGTEYIFIDSDEFINTDHFKQEAPNIFNYLNRHRETLEKRVEGTQKNWFDYLAVRNKKVFDDNANKLKIHVPGLSRLEEQWFFKSKNDFYVGGDLVTITLYGNEEKLEKIFEYLNSDEFSEYYEATGAKKGKRTVFTQNIIANIVIPREIAESSSPTLALF